MGIIYVAFNSKSTPERIPLNTIDTYDAETPIGANDRNNEEALTGNAKSKTTSGA